MPKLPRLLLRVGALAVLAAAFAYDVQTSLSGNRQPGFDVVLFLAFIGVLGIWQLSAAPEELESATVNLREMVRRTTIWRWFIVGVAILSFGVYQLFQHDSTGLIAVLAGGVFVLVGLLLVSGLSLAYEMGLLLDLWRPI